MLTSVTLQNFFSFANAASVPLSPSLNVLVGINGSGKSNFIKALRLLYEGISGDGLRNLIQLEWGGYDQVSHARRNGLGDIRLQFTFPPNPGSDSWYRAEGSPVYGITISAATDGTFRLSERITLKNTKDASETLLFESKAGKGLVRSASGALRDLTEAPYAEASARQMELRFRYLPEEGLHPLLCGLRRAIQQFGFYGFFNTSFSSPARKPAPAAGSHAGRLSPDGENMAQVLHSMRAFAPDAFAHLETFLRRISPNFQQLVFSEAGEKVRVRFVEKHLSHSVSARHISDGTLRYLLYLSIFLNPGRGLAVCIDEPESGLHPDMLHSLSEAMQQAAGEGTQLILATHSPLLLNSFELDDLLIFDKNAENQTLVHTVNGDDFSSLTGLSLPGQLWLSGHLGGKRW